VEAAAVILARQFPRVVLVAAGMARQAEQPRLLALQTLVAVAVALLHYCLHILVLLAAQAS